METVTVFKRGWRRHAAFAAIFALLFHAVFLLVHRPVSANPGEPAGGNIVICTALGLKVVALDDLAGSSTQSDRSDKTGIVYCPVCLSAQLAGAFVSPAAVEFPRPTIAPETIVVRPSAESGFSRTIIASHPPRAPPSIV